MFFPRVRDTKAAIRQAQLTRERWVEIRRGVSGAAFEKAYQALINKGIDGAEEVMIKNPKTDLEIQYEQLLMMKR